MTPAAPRPIARYRRAVLASGAALLLRFALTGLVGPSLPTYLTFFPAVMLAAMLCGWGPGLVATAVSAFLALYWVLPPVEQFAVTGRVDAVGLALFLLPGGGMSLVAELYRCAQHRAATLSCWR